MSLRKAQELQLKTAVFNLTLDVALKRHSLTFWQMSHAFIVDI